MTFPYYQPDNVECDLYCFQRVSGGIAPQLFREVNSSLIHCYCPPLIPSCLTFFSSSPLRNLPRTTYQKNYVQILNLEFVSGRPQTDISSKQQKNPLDLLAPFSCCFNCEGRQNWLTETSLWFDSWWNTSPHIQSLPCEYWGSSYFL